MPDIQITENGVAKLLHNLNPHKAAGPDNITPRVLKELSSEVSSILTLIFRKSYAPPVGYHKRVPSESHVEMDLVFGVGPHGS
jgi:hypothetical protein